MAKKKPIPAHTGHSSRGNTRDVKIDRIANVTIFKRGSTYYLYYREHKKTRREKVEGNLNVARATAAKIAAALEEGKLSPYAFNRTSPKTCVAKYLDYAANVQDLAMRSQDRYRAALDRFLEFCTDQQVSTIDLIDPVMVEEFVRYLRSTSRSRNGHTNGKKSSYKLKGIKVILGVCKTAFNWAAKHRMLPPYTENPFSQFSIDQLRDLTCEDEGREVFTPQQQQRFFQELNAWQRGLFLTLACYGLRAGELTHLLIQDVDLETNTIHIRSKPKLFWRVKNSRKRDLPLVGELRQLFKEVIGNRKAGFVFLNKDFYLGKSNLQKCFKSSEAFLNYIDSLVQSHLTKHPNATERELLRTVVEFSRQMGQIPVKRLRAEFCSITAKIGCEEFTRTHDLRHFFSSRAQEAGVNPLLVQSLLGHSSLDMTNHYTHLGMAAKADGIQMLLDSITHDPCNETEVNNDIR